jgi:glycosyltransferase involved in cell wall biosynthesis
VRIGLDYSLAVSHPPGAGRYVRELVRALVRLEDRPALALLEFGREAELFETPALGLAFGDPHTRRVRVRWPRRALTWSARLGRGADTWLGGVDVFHQSRLPAAPVRSARQTLAVAELPPEGSPRAAELAAAWRAAAAVLVFSSDARARLGARFTSPPGGIHVVPVGCEHWRRELAELPPPVAPARVLVLGRLAPEHAPLALLAACAELAARGGELALRGEGLELALAGSAPKPAELAAPELAEFTARSARTEHGLRVLTVPAGTPSALAREHALPQLVAGAGVLVHLVPDALTPVTPLEALALGVPVVCPRLPAFTEALGDEAFYVDLAECRREPRVLADALEAALRSRRDRAACDRRTLHARAFTWEANARATLALWHQLASQRLRPVQ